MNDFGLLVGRYLSSLPSLTDQELRELLLDSSGRLIISGRYLEDAAHSSGDAGLQIFAVRHDADSSLVSDDGDYSPLQVDATGRLKVAADLVSSAEYAEDSAHVSGDIGNFILAVRQDTLASSTSTDGDYAAIKVNAKGEVYTKDSDVYSELQTIAGYVDGVEALLTSIDGSVSSIDTNVSDIETELLDQGTTLDNIETSIDNIESDIDSITKAEDSAHVSGDFGVMSLAVRHDADSSLVSADGDYAPLQVNSDGKLKVAGTVELSLVGSEAYTVTDALAAAADGIETITASATPWVTVASLSLESGTAYVYGWQWACDQNAHARLITDDTSDIVVYKNSLNSSAEPERSEHWSEGGRIEIAGATDLEIKLQIKKRSATGGNANGTGSIHIRTA